jgi:uncharacterized Rossmann fold enzyme
LSQWRSDIEYISRTGGKILPGKLIEDLSIDTNKDRTSAELLSRMIPYRDQDWRSLTSDGLAFLIIGPKFYGIPSGSIDDFDMIIVADSAIDAFYPIEGCPDIMVTDLDGNPDLIARCAENGTSTVIHAHGDNIARISNIVPNLSGMIIGTCQTEPPPSGLKNIGGFTDGDRSAYLADFLGARTITLAGFDFTAPVKKPGSDPARKKLKLEWARKYLEALAQKRGKSFVVSEIIEI